MSKDSKLIFVIIAIIFSLGVSLNYFYKSPNDGTLYNLAAKYLLETGLLIDPTVITSKDFFPTPQFAMVFILAFLMFAFGDFWIFFYILILSYIWIVVFKKIKIFLESNYTKNTLLIFFFLFLIFFNYDYLISSTSFYNEAFYYPFLVFFLIKTIDLIKRKKDVYKENYFFILFLVLGILFRIQHVALILGLLVFFITQKNIKNTLITTYIFLCILVIFYLSYSYILSFNDPNILAAPNSNGESENFYNRFRELINSMDSSLFFKNLRVHVSAYSHFLSIPKIIDFTLPNKFSTFKELSYLFLSILIIYFFIGGVKKNKDKKISVFLLSFLFFNSLYLFLLPDVTTRYFLPTNFVIIYFLFLEFKSFRLFLIDKKIKLLLYLKYFCVLFIFMIFSKVCYNYFSNANVQAANTFSLNMLIKEFNYNRGGNYQKDTIFIGKEKYIISWWTSLPTLNISSFFDPKFYLDIDKNNKDFFYLGSKTHFISLHENFLKNFKIKNKILKIEDFSYSKFKTDDISVWKIFIR